MSAHAVMFQPLVSARSPVGPEWRPPRPARTRFRLRFSRRGSEKPISMRNAKSADEERARHAARMYAAVAT